MKNMQKENTIEGQEILVKELTKLFEIFKFSEGMIRPHFILTGESGSGKTLTINTLANALDLNYLEINAAQLTKEGTAGNSLSKALSPLKQCGNKKTICFVDEFDKLFVSGNNNSDLAHETTNGVQNEFLKILESESTSVFGDYGKYIEVKVNNVLFVFGGAFNNQKDITLDDLRDFGIKTEFLGRVGLVFNTKPLTLEVLYHILDQSVLLKNYLCLFENVNKEDIVTLIREQIKINFEQNTLGARMINTLIHHFFIKGGFTDKEVGSVTFQKPLSL